MTQVETNQETQVEKLVVLIRERGWEETRWSDYFAVTAEDPEQSFRTAIKEFLETEEGRAAIENSCDDFNWGDAMMVVPDEFWEKHGIRELSRGDIVTVQITEHMEIYVRQDEILVPDSYDALDLEEEED